MFTDIVPTRQGGSADSLLADSVKQKATEMEERGREHLETRPEAVLAVHIALA